MDLSDKNLILVMAEHTDTTTSAKNPVLVLVDGSTGYYFADEGTPDAASAGSSVTTFTKITYNDGTNEDETPGTGESYSALSLGGSSNTLTIPITAIKSLEINGLNLNGNDDKGTNFYDFEIADGTKINLVSDPAFTSAGATGGSLETSLTSLLASSGSFGSVNAIPMDMDPSGTVATAATSLVGTFNNYFTGTSTSTPTLTDATSALVTELKKATASSPTASDAINVVDMR